MVSLDIEGAFDNAWWPALETSCAPLAASEPPWPGPGYLRDREVVVKYAGGSAGRGLQGLYTRFYSRSNLLEPYPGFPTPRTRGTRRIRAGVRG
ncbi:hypothetical protein EVAR_89376_1 [Eumeta japonica]|uniref:Reverse transcriptase domain-containing protein n=1 Tax=Eumeta variegata TaxID=151549 RepID=A0A4C1ZUI1_EUMVA|nr:hypothetical protein EVAR_89376_1 [Eumeta japonica]